MEQTQLFTQEQEVNDIIDFAPSTAQEPNSASTPENDAQDMPKESSSSSATASSEEPPQTPQSTEPPKPSSELGEPPKEAPVQPQAQQQPQPQAQPQAQPESELDRLKRENAELLQRLNEVAEKAFTQPQQRQLTPEEQAKYAEAMRKQVLPFVKDDATFDEVMSKSENFNALLTGVVNTAVERSLRLMPQVAMQLVEQQMTFKSVVDAFYQDNADLKPHKKYVGFIANEIASQHPDWGIDKVLQEVEKEARVRLNLQRPSGAVSTPQPVQQATPQGNATANPGFAPGATRGRKLAGAPENLNSQEQQVLEIL